MTATARTARDHLGDAIVAALTRGRCCTLTRGLADITTQQRSSRDAEFCEARESFKVWYMPNDGLPR